MKTNIRRDGWIVAAFCASVLVPAARAENRPLAERFAEAGGTKVLLSAAEWTPFPRADNRAAWGTIPADVRERIVALGEAYAARPLPPLPATLYLDFRRTGNRSRYQDVWFERRAMLCGLALAECVDGTGRFLDPLADAIWAVCEESSWTLPAHIGTQKAQSGLPDTTEPIIALFSAETACSLAWIVYLLEDRLNQVSPLIAPRIRREIDARILAPYLVRDDFAWMGFGSQARPNNWNPWINSNVLAASLLLERDADRRRDLVLKVLRSLDRFFVPHPADGSCDEGPSYWGRAGASLFDNLELLHGATRGRFDVFADPVVREIGRYIPRTHIAGPAFVCVGDCDAHPDVPRDLVFRYGRRIDDPGMRALAQSGQAGDELWSEPRGPWSLMRILYTLFNLADLRSARPTPPYLRDVWLGDADMELMAARDAAGTADGLFVAAWGAHNGQSHNHNDVGNYVVYLDGRPVLIDVGRPTYTRQTFSSDRYKIWAMQSAFHNLPTVNGRMQGAGRRYAAKDVVHKAGDESAELRMDLAAAYPPEAGIVSWSRTVRLARGEGVEVADEFVLRKPSADVVQHLITPCRVEVLQPGELRLRGPEAGPDVRVRFSPPNLGVDVETIDLDDEKLVASWGPRLHRISLRAPRAQEKDVWTVRIAPAR